MSRQVRARVALVRAALSWAQPAGYLLSILAGLLSALAGSMGASSAGAVPTETGPVLPFPVTGRQRTRPGLSDALAGLFRAPGGALGVGMGGRGGAGICCLAEAGQDWPGTTRELRAATVPWVSRNLGIP